MLVGQHGVGKNTWASKAPNSLTLNFEDGCNDIDCAKTEHLKTYEAAVNALSWLVQNEHEFQWVVVDTVDWLEQLIFKAVATEKGKANIGEIPYGKGPVFAVEKWRFLLNGFDALRSKGVGIILLAHSKIETFENPEGDRYDRYEPDLNEHSSSLLQEWCDEVLFASFRVFTKPEDLGFNKTRSIAVGGKERFIRTNESAAAVAKNRLRLPDELPMDWDAFAKYLPPPGNINGVVTNGSSKAAVA